MKKTYKIFPLPERTVKTIFFVLSLLTGIYLVRPMLTYQPWLSQGDHGLCLYASEAVLRGEMPYHDFHWFYGPLMPYFFAIFFKILGPSIPSILFAQFLLILTSGLLIYLCLSLFLPSSFSYIASIWYWTYSYDFFYTYNHSGGLTLSLAVIYMLFCYIKKGRLRYLYFGLFFCTVLSLIKINIAISTLAAFLLSCLIHGTLTKSKTSGKKLFYSLGFTSPILMITLNWLFVRGLPFYIIRQGYQYFGNDKAVGTYPGILSSAKLLMDIMIQTISASWTDFFFAATITFSFIFIIQLIIQKNFSKQKTIEILTVLISLVLFYIFNIHEFLLSGIIFRKNWSIPFSILLIYSILGYSRQNLNKYSQKMLTIAILLICFFQINNNNAKIKKAKNPLRFLGIKKAEIYVGNPFPWVQTVTDTTNFINRTLKDDELFFALPYEPLYYFLTSRPSPTRQLAFFDFVQIPPQQEKSIIEEIKSKKVNWVLLSSRNISTDPGLGVLGITNCPLIMKYISDNFEEVARFGEWTFPGGWVWNHGTALLKRKNIK